MKGMSNGGDTQAVAAQLEHNFGFTSHRDIAGLSPVQVLVNASEIKLFFIRT